MSGLVRMPRAGLNAAGKVWEVIALLLCARHALNDLEDAFTAGRLRGTAET